MNLSTVPSLTIYSPVSLVTGLLSLFNKYFADHQDPRTRHYPLVSVSPWTIIAIMSTYLILTTRLIPRWMKNREPFELRGIMFAYNCIMVTINTFFFAAVVYRMDYGRRFLDFKYHDEIDTSPSMLLEIHLGYFYWLSKFADLADTFFFSLRKKSSHITFLHLYHHTVVPIFGWLALRINPDIPPAGLFGLINSFLHVLMYSYYALAAFGPSVQKYLWWKRYITILQLGQFAIYAMFGVVVFIYQTGFPVFWLYFALSQPPFFFYMFYDFYRKSYGNKKRTIKLVNENGNKNTNSHEKYS